MKPIRRYGVIEGERDDSDGDTTAYVAVVASREAVEERL